MDKILHDPKDPKLWELWYIPYKRTLNYGNYGICLIMGNAGQEYGDLGVSSGIVSSLGFSVMVLGTTVNPRKLEHGFRRICARIPYTLP